MLAERAHRRLDDALGFVDDSDGWLTDHGAQLGDLHLQACQAGPPDPAELAEALVDLELDSELDTFHRAAARYAPLLGKAGIAEYRRLLQPHAARLERGDSGFSERFAVQQALVGAALATGDPDQLIAVKAGDLRSPDDYLEVAAALVDAGRHEEALDWAQRGLSTHRERTWHTPPLAELAADLHRRLGAPRKAVEVFWSGFTAGPSLPGYRRLLQEAEVNRDAAAARDRALTHLRERLSPATSSILVEVLLHDNDVDAAWRVASEHGCTQQLWMALARARERTHPQDAIDVYEPAVATAIAAKNANGYRRAVDLLANIRDLRQALGQPDAFDSTIISIRTEHRRKRSLMTLLDQQGW